MRGIAKEIDCDGCGKTYETSEFDHAIPNGWVIPYTTFGFYDGFTDDHDHDRWILCHDCVVKFLKTFPRLAESIMKGSHQSLTHDKPCCDFAWRPTELFGKYEHDDDGNYVPVKGVHAQQAKDGEWIPVDGDGNLLS